MVDLTKFKYHVVVVDSAGKQYEITDLVEELGWEEPKNQIAMKMSFGARNDMETSFGTLSSLILPGTLVVVLAEDDNGYEEVARAKVEVWNPVVQGSNSRFKATCYDELYSLQKSQMNYIVKKNTYAYKAIQKIFKDWKVPVGTYNGPSVKLKRFVFERKYISDIINEMLAYCVKKGDVKCVLRMMEGKVNVLPVASNENIYHFDDDNIEMINEKQSIADLITRIKIMNSKNKKLKATINGLTEYGVRQRIEVMENKQKLKDAKTEAKDLMKEKGVIEKTVQVKMPDVPYMRKGDVVHISAGTADAYFDILGITHDAESGKMTLDLEYSERNDYEGEEKKKYHKGDIVYFKGGTCHKSYKKSKGFIAPEGKAKIKKIVKVTKKNKKTVKFPYRLVHTSMQTNVNGYVSEDQFV